MSTEIKTYNRRDSATAALRKLGIKAADYSLYIMKNPDGTFKCNISLAKEAAAAETKPVVKKTKLKKKVAKKSSTKKVNNKSREQKESVSSYIKKQILNGKTNEQIFHMCQKKFGEDKFNESKRYYPAWNRSKMRRESELPPNLDPKLQNKENVVFE